MHDLVPWHRLVENLGGFPHVPRKQHLGCGNHERITSKQSNLDIQLGNLIIFGILSSSHCQLIPFEVYPCVTPDSFLPFLGPTSSHTFWQN